MTTVPRLTRMLLAAAVAVAVSSSPASSAVAGPGQRRASAEQSVGLVEITSTLAGRGRLFGTGMILDAGGLVVTNHHVVDGATGIRVTDVTTGVVRRARLLGYDAVRDVAVLRLEDVGGAVPVTVPVTVSTAPVRRADRVVAVGDAGGDGGSLTAAPGRVIVPHVTITLRDESGRPARLRRLVAVTSDVVPGDSGGALRDASGQVVAMSVAATTGRADPIGFAIPIARVQRVVAQVLSGVERGSVEVGYPAFLGVELAGPGTRITGVVRGGPAAGVGLRAGDRVTGLGSIRVRTADQLRRVLARHEPDDLVDVRWVDPSGSPHRGTTTLAAGPVG